MKINLATLQAFSASLLAMADVARHSAPNRMTSDALMVLRTLVPFRSAWWGECSDSDASVGTRRRNWLHGRINLSASFAREWNQLAEADAFAAESIRNLGRVVRAIGDDDPDGDVSAFSRRHDLANAMAVTLELPGSGMSFFVALYRGAGDVAFDDVQAALFAEFTRHLLQHWRARVRDMLLTTSGTATDSFALADAHGELLYLGARLGRLLHQQFSGWGGSTLPPPVTALLAQAPCAMALGSEQLTVQACEALMVLALHRGGGRNTLPPRERTAAMLYAQGHSYKAIARLLNLSPATVRTYLRSVYLQLGVRNKIELGGALGGSVGDTP